MAWRVYECVCVYFAAPEAKHIIISIHYLIYMELVFTHQPSPEGANCFVGAIVRLIEWLGGKTGSVRSIAVFSAVQPLHWWPSHDAAALLHLENEFELYGIIIAHKSLRLEMDENPAQGCLGKACN